jgi:hypothetical protein
MKKPDTGHLSIAQQTDRFKNQIINYFKNPLHNDTITFLNHNNNAFEKIAQLCVFLSDFLFRHKI